MTTPDTVMPSLPPAFPSGRRLRVMQVIGTMHIGGAENVVVELASGLDRSRFDVALCCTRELGVLAERLRSESVEVTLAAPPDRRLRHFTPLFLARALARFKPDVVHTHGTPSLLHAGPLAMVGSLPKWIHTFHFGNYAAARGRQMKAERLFCRAASQLVAVSETQRQQIIEFHGVKPDRIMTIVNGVRQVSVDERERARRRAVLGFGPDEIVVGCVAVLTEQKGITYLLQAARRFLQRDPRLRLLIVGGGPLEAALKAEATSLGIAPRTVFTGWRPDGAQWLQALDVFVMSSLWEALPMALLEAMSAQRPVIVTDVGDNRTIVENGRSGMVVAPRDPDAIAAAVETLVTDRARAARIADDAGRRFSDRFRTAHMVGAYQDLYTRRVRQDVPATSGGLRRGVSL